MRIEHCQDVEEIRPLGRLWLEKMNAGQYGLDTDLDVAIEDLKLWKNDFEGAILLAKVDDEPIGVFAMFVVASYLGRQKIAIEKYWFVKDKQRMAGPRLYVEAVKWAKQHGCSHLITNASRLASDQHDSVCRFLERTGAMAFETSYIYRL